MAVSPPARPGLLIELEDLPLEGARLFHFSGFDPAEDRVSLYTPEVTLESLGERSAPYERYRRLLLEAGHDEPSRWPYAFGRFDDGLPG